MRFKRPFTVILFCLLLIVSAVAKQVTYPREVEDDISNGWKAVIHVTGTRDPNFKIVQIDNTTAVPSTFKNPDGSFDIVVVGQLIDTQKDGSIVFKVDPKGRTTRGKIVIRAPHRKKTGGRTGRD